MHLGTLKTKRTWERWQSRVCRWGTSCVWWEKQRRPGPHPLLPRHTPLTFKQMDFYNSARHVKASGARGWKGKGWGRRKRGHFARNPRWGEGREDENFSRTVEASQLACLSPRKTSYGVGPLVWECGRRSPSSCQGLPPGAACSSSLPLPCCSHPSQSTFAAWEKRKEMIQ